MLKISGDIMKNKSIETVLVHGGYNPDEHNRSRMVPIYQTSAFCYDSADHAAELFAMDAPGHIYQRIDNPTVKIAEDRIAASEGGVGAVAFSSGMAAVSSFILNFLKSGDSIAAANCLYGGSMGLFTDTLPSLGITTHFFDPLDGASLKNAITDSTKLVFVENLANPSLVVPDYHSIKEICDNSKLPLAVDNTIATPFLTNPISYGADFVIHSCTKYMEGHGSIIGGAVVDSGKFAWDVKRYPMMFEAAPGGKSFVDKYGQLAFIMRMRAKTLMNTGGCMAPLHAWLLLHGMESLHVRYPRHCENAEYIAKKLLSHSKVAWVNYPGFEDHHSHLNAKKYFRNYFGGMLGFGLKGGYDACRKMIDNIKLISHCTNIGDAKTLMIHPASTTHRNMPEQDRINAGIGNDFIRLSVGLENKDDLFSAIEEAMS